MARGPSTKVVLNRSGIERVRLAVADGLFEVGKAIIDTAKPPDLAEGYYYQGKKGSKVRHARHAGLGLVKRGGVLAHVDGKKVGGYSLDGRQPKAPRAAHVSRTRGTVIIVGWGWPARWVNLGSIHNTPKPFFVQAENEVLPNATPIMAAVVRPKLAGR